MKPIMEAALLGLCVEITRKTGIEIPGIKRECKGKIQEVKQDKSKRKSRKIGNVVWTEFKKEGTVIHINDEPKLPEFPEFPEFYNGETGEWEKKIQEIPDTEVVDSIYPVNDTIVKLDFTSPVHEIETYFRKISKLQDSGEEFPVNLDEIYMLVYEARESAVRALKDNFLQNIDYQVFDNNVGNPQGGRPSITYMLSVACLEYFIVKKVRPVFEVYRQVFHVVRKSFQVPETFADALELAAKQQRQIQEQEKYIVEQKPKIEFEEVAMETTNINLFT